MWNWCGRWQWTVLRRSGSRSPFPAGSSRRNPGSGGKEPLILEREAGTVFAACQMIQKSGSGYVSYGHVTECIIGKGAAGGRY